MKPKTKKGLIIAGIVLDIGITVFLFVIAIIMLATMPAKGEDPTMGGMIGYFQGSKTGTTVYLWTCVVPLFVLLALNIGILMWYIKKVANKKVALADLNAEQKEALRAQLLAEMSKPSEEKPAEEAKEEKKDK